MDNMSFSSFTESDKQHFFTLLLYAINIDSDINKNETKNIMKLAKILNKSKEETLVFIDNIKRKIVKKDSLVDISASCRHFSSDSEIVIETVFECLVTLCFADGVFHLREQELIKALGRALGLSGDKCDSMVKDVELSNYMERHDNELGNSAVKMPNEHVLKIFNDLSKLV